MHIKRIKYCSCYFIFAGMLMFASCNKTSGDDSTDKMEQSGMDGLTDDSSGYDDLKDDYAAPAVNPKPTLKSMSYDLIGRSVTEGVNSGYYPSNWRYLIEDGDVMGLQVEDVIADDNSQYVAVIRLKLRGTTGDNDTSNYYYDTKAKIRYRNHTQDGWILDFVNSLGMTIVSDGAYDDLIVETHDESGSFNNNGDIPLTVGGRYLMNDEWHKFLINVPPHGQSAPLYDGVMFASYVDDSKIDFVIR